MSVPTEMQMALAIDDAWRYARLALEDAVLYVNPADFLELCGNGTLPHGKRLEFACGLYGVPVEPYGGLARGRYEVRRRSMALADATGVP